MRLFSTILATAALLWSCSGSGSTAPGCGGGDTLTSRSQLLTLVGRPGWVEATVADPWHPGGKPLGRYALVADSSAADIPDGFTRVGVPLRRSIVYSAVHTSAIDRLGALDAVAAIADGNWLSDADPVKRRVLGGAVRDIGPSTSPSVETVIDLQPDAILLAPYENGSRGAIDKAGAPLVEMADYMESDPLGRAEWLLLLGELYGKRPEARRIYSRVAARYDSIRALTGDGPRPRVFTETPVSGVWYVPAGGSYMAQLIADAGGDYVWADTPGTGSLPLDLASVIDRAGDADIWLIKTFGPVTPSSLRSTVPHIGAFKAFPAGVRACDSSTSGFFNDLAFTPDLILDDLARVMRGADSTVYFLPLRP